MTLPFAPLDPSVLENAVQLITHTFILMKLKGE